MRTANQINCEAVEVLERLADEAAAGGHHALAGFLNKKSSQCNYGAPVLDRAEPNAEETEWHPKLRAAESVEELQPS